MNRIEAQFTGLRYFALDGTDHPDHATQGRMIRRPGETATPTTATHDASSTGPTLPDTALAVPYDPGAAGRSGLLWPPC